MNLGLQNFLKLISYLALGISLILATSCSPKPKKAKAKLNLISSMAISNINMDGGAVIYGQSSTGNTWGRIFKGGNEFIIDMAYGSWNFAIIAYSGPSELQGITECAILNGVNIGDENQIIDVKINSASCPQAGLRPLKIKRCLNADFISADPVTNCTEISGVESYQVIVEGHRNGGLDGTLLTSPCITETSFNSATALKIPTGGTNTQGAPISLIGFTGTNCDVGTEIPLTFSRNANQSENPNSIKSILTPNEIYLALNNEDSTIDSSGPVLTMPAASSSATIDVNSDNWINSSNAASFSVTGTCETGLQVSFTYAGIPFGTPTACAAGTFTQLFDFSATIDSTVGNSLVATQTDASGNPGTATLILKKDTLAPSAYSSTSYTPAATTFNYISLATFDVNFNPGSDAGSGLGDTTVRLYSSGCSGLLATNTEISSATSSTFARTHGETISFTIQPVDLAGNPAPESGCFTSVTIDTIPPAAPVVSGTTGFNSGTTITRISPLSSAWTVSASGDIASQTVTYYAGGGCSGVPTNQNFADNTTATDTSFTPTPSVLSTYSFNVTATDLAGNAQTSGCSNNVIFDDVIPTGPSLLGFQETSPTLAGNLNYDFSGATDAGGILDYNVAFYSDASCTILEETVSVSHTGGTHTATTTSLLTDGTDDGNYNVIITTNDNAGNSVSSTCSGESLIKDNTPPAAPTLNATNWLTTPDPTYSKRLETNPWTLSGDTNTIDVNIYDSGSCAGTLINSFTGLANTTIDYDFDVTKEETYVYEVVAYDLAGNSSPSTCSTSILVKQASMGHGGKYIDGEIPAVGRLYALAESGTLEIFDVNAPPSLSLIGGIRFPGFEADKMAFFNNHIYLYKSTISPDVHVWTTTGAGTIDAPVYLGVMNAGATGLKDHTFAGGHMWLLAGNNVVGLDITTPGTTGTNVTSFASGSSGCNAIEFDPINTFLFVGCGSFLVPINIANPAIPVPATPHDPVTTMTFDTLRWSTTENGMFAGGGGIGGSFAELNLTTPTTPESYTELSGIGTVFDIGNDDAGRMAIARDGTPDTIASLTIPATAGPAPSVFRDLNTVTSNQAYVGLIDANALYGLSTHGIQVRNHPVGGAISVDFEYYKGGSSRLVTSDPGGAYAAVSNFINGAIILDTSDPRNPSLAFQIPGSIRAVLAGVGNKLYVIDGLNLKVWNMTSLASPSLSATIPLGISGIYNDAPLKIDFSKGASGYAYVGSDAGDVDIIDIGGTSVLATINTGCGAVKVKGIHFFGNKLFITCEDQDRFVYDITTPASPALNDSATVNGTLNVEEAAGAGNFVYVARGSLGFNVFEINASTGLMTDHSLEPGVGTYKNLYNPPGSTKLYASVWDGIELFDISTPSSPVFQTSLNVPGVCGDLAPRDPSAAAPTLFYLSCGSTGFQVVDTTFDDFFFQ